ncbi:Phytanoyl-CoA dioxygenase [Vitis vinifera]|uniref:Phytanoyl-CoA dioxygenase n=1 Tax=Vitis vinifera TaxID=29760 RepID=A0A438C128_VITVI|nr:Phytanoyl-CoA dioxygenase [Vitis vinifera]
MSVSSLSALPNPAFFFLVYVDDIIITGRKSYEVQSLISHLHMLFSLKDLGPLNFLLGIEVHKLHDGNFHLSQGKYVTDLLERAKMLNPKSMPTPMIIGALLSAQLGNLMQDPTLYRSIVGALHYVTIIRPEISYYNKVCQFMQHPFDIHWKTIKRILRFLKGTTHHGYCVYLGGNLVSWSSKKQQTVSRSSTKAKYCGLAHVTTKILWLQSLLEELGVKQTKPPLVWCDNLSTISFPLEFYLPEVVLICQQPGIGGEVVPHQDNSFLYTEPPTCTGLWLALEDATILNGCLWAIPGSHKNGLVRRFIRGDEGVYFDQPSPSYDDKDFVPVEVKAGSLVVLHGDLIHQSFENQSPKSRHAYSLHVVDTDGCKWAQENWIRRKVDPEPLYES